MNKTRLHKHVKFVAKKSAKKIGVWQAIRSISREKYTEKVSASLLYGLLSSIAVNFFFQPGHVYSSGATGLAQVLSALSVRTLGFEIPVSLTFYAINIPLLILAWNKIGHKFTIFTFITVTMSSLFIQVMPHVTLTEDPLINAIFGGLVMGTGIGFGLKSRISSGKYLSDCQWDYHDFCRYTFWLEICPVFNGDNFCLKPSNGCDFY